MRMKRIVCYAMTLALMLAGTAISAEAKSEKSEKGPKSAKSAKSAKGLNCKTTGTFLTGANADNPWRSNFYCCFGW